MQQFMERLARAGAQVRACDLPPFDLGGVDIKEDWAKWFAKYLPSNLSSLQVEAIPFIPSPECVDAPWLGSPSDFEDNDLSAPRALVESPEKQLELAQFNGRLLLARLRLAMDRGGGFREQDWRKRLHDAISMPTINRAFPSIAAPLVAPTPTSRYPLSLEEWAEAENARMQGVIDWIFTQARTLPRSEVVTPMMEKVGAQSAHPSLRRYLAATRLKPVLPELQHLITDLYVVRTSSSSSARIAASRTLHDALETLRGNLRELGGYAEPMAVGTWCREERSLVLTAIAEQGGKSATLTQREREALLPGLG